MPSLYLINPRNDFTGYYTSEVYQEEGAAPAALMADLAVTTVAGLCPPDFDLSMCDEAISPVNFDTPARYIGITGKRSQLGRMKALAREFRRRGKIVICGGPHASLVPEQVRPWCDILLQGEAEDVFGCLAADLRSGTWQPEYVGGRPDLGTTRSPRWDLYPNHRALVGALQTSRGCPFECEFCDVIQYLGRKPRFKAVEQVLSELDDLYRHGYRHIFLCDDNFTVHRARARTLLHALKQWNRQQVDGHVLFTTQASIDAARDPELLHLAAAAGLRRMFVGIETPSEESLREAHKRQNLKIDLLSQVQVFLDHGILVSAGMVVGFDADHPDIFDRQYEFAMASPIPTFTLFPLQAPEGTPLYARLASAGRIALDTRPAIWSTNIIPLHMDRDDLLRETRALAAALYTPAAFGQRLLRCIDRLGDPGDPLEGTTVRAVDQDALHLVSRFRDMGPAEADLWDAILARMTIRPHCRPIMVPTLLQYMQIRRVLAEDAAPRRVYQGALP